MKKKGRDPSWKLRHALGHKVEPDLKKYRRKVKHKKKVTWNDSKQLTEVPE